MTFSQLVSAHVLETDGSVGAVLHVSPADDPVAGEESSFFFEFKDKDNKFKPENCDCTFVVKQGGAQVYTQPLFENSADPSLSNASASYTFPKRDIYQIIVKGEPKNPGDFEPFTLTYDIRVARTSDSAGAQTDTQSGVVGWIQTHVVHVIGGIVAVGLLGWVVLRKTKKRTEKS